MAAKVTDLAFHPALCSPLTSVVKMLLIYPLTVPLVEQGVNRVFIKTAKYVNSFELAKKFLLTTLKI